MDKESSKYASSLRRSLLAERIQIRQEWSRLKGTEGPTTTANVLKKRACNNEVHKIICKPAIAKSSQHPASSDALSGVVALVEVGSEPRALALRAALAALGATVVPAWSPLVTHLVWANGGCRITRAKARALASRLVSPLWVEACAASAQRLPERAFPTVARESDLPSPGTLRRLLKKAEMENIPLVDLLSDSTDGAEQRPARLRISSESSDGSDASRESTDVEPETRVNTAPRRALPASTSPMTPAKKSRRKLFTQKEPNTDTELSDKEDESRLIAPGNKRDDAMPTQRYDKATARLQRMIKMFAEGKPVKPRRNSAHVTNDGPRIVLTGMTRMERSAVSRAILTLNGKIHGYVSRKTTHILLGSCPERLDKDNCYITGIDNINVSSRQNVEEIPRCDKNGRTLKALLGAVRGCYVLYAQWALDSCKEKKWLHHHGYEVAHLKKISQIARVERKATRLMRSEYAYDVFSGIRVRISPDVTQKEAAIELLTLCGAVIVNQNSRSSLNGRPLHLQEFSQPRNSEVRTDHDIVLGNGENEVNSKWVFDSVSAARMRATRIYVNSFYNAIRMATQDL